ncbi:MAG: hypothetical protein AB1403_10445 [Candidatus Riflebacteria bacterium]
MENVSLKQKIYIDLLMRALPLIRNSLTWENKALAENKAWLFEEAELVHNISLSIIEPEFNDHDFHFLNFHARRYYENGHKSWNYIENIKSISTLMDEVPEKLKYNLQWNGPSKN